MEEYFTPISIATFFGILLYITALIILKIAPKIIEAINRQFDRLNELKTYEQEKDRAEDKTGIQAREFLTNLAKVEIERIQQSEKDCQGKLDIVQEELQEALIKIARIKISHENSQTSFAQLQEALKDTKQSLELSLESFGMTKVKIQSLQGDVRELRGRVSAIKFILEKEQAQNYELISRANLLDKKLEKKDRIIEEKSRIITEQSEEIKKLNKNISNKLD